MRGCIGNASSSSGTSPPSAGPASSRRAMSPPTAPGAISKRGAPPALDRPQLVTSAVFAQRSYYPLYPPPASGDSTPLTVSGELTEAPVPQMPMFLPAMAKG